MRPDLDSAVTKCSFLNKLLVSDTKQVPHFPIDTAQITEWDVCLGRPVWSFKCI